MEKREKERTTHEKPGAFPRKTKTLEGGKRVFRFGPGGFNTAPVKTKKEK
jgi:hypothetical protein